MTRMVVSPSASSISVGSEVGWPVLGCPTPSLYLCISERQGGNDVACANEVRCGNESAGVNDAKCGNETKSVNEKPSGNETKSVND